MGKIIDFPAQEIGIENAMITVERTEGFIYWPRS